MKNLKESAIFKNQFQEIKNELINYLSLIEDNKIYYHLDNIKEKQNFPDLQEFAKDLIFTNLYIRDVNFLDMLIHDFLEIGLISERDAKYAKIAEFVFYTDKFDFPEKVENYEIIFAIREFKKYNEEF